MSGCGSSHCPTHCSCGPTRLGFSIKAGTRFLPRSRLVRGTAFWVIPPSPRPGPLDLGLQRPGDGWPLLHPAVCQLPCPRDRCPRGPALVGPGAGRRVGGPSPLQLRGGPCFSPAGTCFPRVGMVLPARQPAGEELVGSREHGRGLFRLSHGPPSPSLTPQSMSTVWATDESPPLRMSEGTELLTRRKPRLRGSGWTPGRPSYWTEVLLGSGARRETGVWDPGLPAPVPVRASWGRRSKAAQPCVSGSIYLPPPWRPKSEIRGQDPLVWREGALRRLPLQGHRSHTSDPMAAISCYLNHPLNNPLSK